MSKRMTVLVLGCLVIAAFLLFWLLKGEDSGGGAGDGSKSVAPDVRKTEEVSKSDSRNSEDTVVVKKDTKPDVEGVAKVPGLYLRNSSSRSVAVFVRIRALDSRERDMSRQKRLVVEAGGESRVDLGKTPSSVVQIRVDSSIEYRDVFSSEAGSFSWVSDKEMKGTFASNSLVAGLVFPSAEDHFVLPIRNFVSSVDGAHLLDVGTSARVKISIQDRKGDRVTLPVVVSARFDDSGSIRIAKFERGVSEGPGLRFPANREFEIFVASSISGLTLSPVSKKIETKPLGEHSLIWSCTDQLSIWRMRAEDSRSFTAIEPKVEAVGSPGIAAKIISQSRTREGWRILSTGNPAAYKVRAMGHRSREVAPNNLGSKRIQVVRLEPRENTLKIRFEGDFEGDPTAKMRVFEKDFDLDGKNVPSRRYLGVPIDLSNGVDIPYDRMLTVILEAKGKTFSPKQFTVKAADGDLLQRVQVSVKPNLTFRVRRPDAATSSAVLHLWEHSNDERSRDRLNSHRVVWKGSDTVVDIQVATPAGECSVVCFARTTGKDFRILTSNRVTFDSKKTKVVEIALSSESEWAWYDVVVSAYTPNEASLRGMVLMSGTPLLKDSIMDDSYWQRETKDSTLPLSDQARANSIAVSGGFRGGSMLSPVENARVYLPVIEGVEWTAIAPKIASRMRVVVDHKAKRVLIEDREGSGSLLVKILNGLELDEAGIRPSEVAVSIREREFPNQHPTFSSTDLLIHPTDGWILDLHGLSPGTYFVSAWRLNSSTSTDGTENSVRLHGSRIETVVVAKDGLDSVELTVSLK